MNLSVLKIVLNRLFLLIGGSRISSCWSGYYYFFCISCWQHSVSIYFIVSRVPQVRPVEGSSLAIKYPCASFVCLIFNLFITMSCLLFFIICRPICVYFFWFYSVLIFFTYLFNSRKQIFFIWFSMSAYICRHLCIFKCLYLFLPFLLKLCCLFISLYITVTRDP